MSALHEGAAPTGANIGPPFSWTTEMMRRAPAHSFIAGLLAYFLMQAVPTHFESDAKKEAWYWEQMEKQRVEFFAQQQLCEQRKEAKIKDVENLCYGAISNTVSLSEKNRVQLDVLTNLIKETCIN